MDPDNIHQTTLTSRAADRLVDLANELRAVDLSESPPIETTIRFMRDSCTLEQQEEARWEKNFAALYRIRTDAATALRLWTAANEAARAWKEKTKAHKANRDKTKLVREYQMSRLNTHAHEDVCLYVGQSQDFAKRMFQHFTSADAQIFGLHLSMWAPADTIDSPILIDYWSLAALDVSPRAAQALEDFMWDEWKPIFGKRGGK
jgi:hypothetical protein